MDLVIMAAGIGSRFGGLKQLQPIDDNNNFIIDYSIYDAIKVGFDHVIFIIKEELYEDFKLTIGNRIEEYVKVDYVFQDNKNVPKSFSIPIDRAKPLGTGHAIMCAKPKITGDFAVINADDFYGRNAFMVAANFLKENKDENKYALIGYKAINTIGDSGTVKRGVCTVNGKTLLDITESVIEKKEDGTLFATPMNKSKKPQAIENDQLVSMNLFAFTRKFLDYLEDYFVEFLEENKDDLSTCEFFLPTVVSNLIKEGKSTVDVLSTTAMWYGITYKSDLEVVKKAVQKMVDDKTYKKDLWK